MGVFLAQDLLLFFLFWELELIPMFLLISIWGTGRKEYSAMKFVLYTLSGSALMLVGFLVLGFSAGTFDMQLLAESHVTDAAISLNAVFFLILAAFAIKLPVFPLHTWLPDAHTDAPTAVSVILAGVLLKMGGYGMIRILVGILPDAGRRLRRLARRPRGLQRALRRHPDAAPDGPQAPRRLLVSVPHGLRAAGRRRAGAGRRDGRGAADVHARHDYRPALRHGRPDLRPHAHAVRSRGLAAWRTRCR